MTVSVSSGCSLFHHYHCCEAISGVPCGIKTVSSLKEFQAWNFLADIFLLVFEKSRIKRGLRCKYQFHLAVVYFTITTAVSGVPCGINKVFRFEEFQAWND